jgi:hypothetical protein
MRSLFRYMWMWLFVYVYVFVYVVKIRFLSLQKSSATFCWSILYRGADKSLARPGRKQATATEDFEFHTSYL